MKTRFIILITTLFLQFIICTISSAQVKSIAATGVNPDASAAVDINFTNKGMLIPRIALTGTTDNTTISSPTNGLLVYDTATAGSAPNNVIPGFYYWKTNKWIPIIGAGVNKGDMRYWDGANWVIILVGVPGECLILSADGVPSWTFLNEGREYVNDVDGNTYNPITIGTQTWLRENLKTTKYNDYTAISNVTNSSDWFNLSNTSTGAYCDYDNNSSNSDVYGRLYNWYAVNTAILCPTGWHVPSDDEWQTLITYIGGSGVAGGKVKEPGLTHWSTPNVNASNSSGFTALPGGIRSGGSFSSLGNIGYWWETINSQNQYSITYNSAGISNTASNPNIGCSVRCLKNLEK